MSAPTKLVIQLATTSNNLSVTVNIPSALQSLDSGELQNTQTGFSGADIAVRNIFKAGVFVDSNGTWWNANQIVSVTTQ